MNFFARQRVEGRSVIILLSKVFLFFFPYILPKQKISTPEGFSRISHFKKSFLSPVCHRKFLNQRRLVKLLYPHTLVYDGRLHEMERSYAVWSEMKNKTKQEIRKQKVSPVPFARPIRSRETELGAVWAICYYIPCYISHTSPICD